MSIIEVSTKSEIETKKKTSLDTQEQFDTMLKDAVNSRLIGYYESGKKVTDQVRNSVTKKCEAMLNSEYRVKYSRTSNISRAEQATQKLWGELKNRVENVTFVGNDGKTYIGSCMIKEVK